MEQGFWVKATDTGLVLEFTEDVRSAGGVFLEENPVPQIIFELRRSDILSDTSSLRSFAVVMFDSEATPGKDPLDAWKLQSLNEQYLSLYTTDTERHALDINALPIDLESPLELTLDFKGSDLGGEYTLSWNPQDYLIHGPRGRSG